MFGLTGRKKKPAEATNTSPTKTTISNTRDEQARPRFYLDSELGKLRYELEHRILPYQFYNNTKSFIRAQLGEGGTFGLYSYIFERAGLANPYTSADFSVNAGKVDEGIYLLTLRLPYPEYMPLCYRIHMVWDEEFGHLAYYTMERSLKDDFLCGWTADGVHTNYGPVENPSNMDGLGLAAEAAVVAKYFKGQLLD